MYEPLISVIMSVYKEPLEWIRLSVESILNQTYRKIEFIIICDNPEHEDGLALLREYAENDKRVILLVNEKNIGLTKSLNRGLSIAKGEYVARMDADDISLQNRFEKQLDLFMKRPDVDVCGSNVNLIGDKEGIVKYPHKDEDVCLYIDNCFAHSTVLMKKWIADLKYNEKCRAAQDYDLWYRAQKKRAVFYNIQEPLVLYRASQNQITNLKKGNQDAVASKVRRAALDDLLLSQNLSLQVADAPITFDTVKYVYDNITIQNEKKQRLLFFLILSVNCSSFELLSFILKNGMISNITMKNILRLLYHNRKKDLFYF